jgi:N-formylglutamate amidohydrolase
MESSKGNIGFDSLNAIDLFVDSNNFWNTNELIFHIPHSSTIIPYFTGYVDICKISDEMDLLTDSLANLIFDIKNVSKLVTPFSRIFCDVERLDDSIEPCYKSGHGFFYTHYDNGELMRTDIDGIKSDIFKNYYLVHQDRLNKIVEEKLKNFGKAIIIDCHTFSDQPFKSDLDQSMPRPDICIGTDDYHTPIGMEYYLVNKFEALGYVVKLNSPYDGVMIPLNHYKSNKDVQGVLIEINRKLYIDDNWGRMSLKIEKLNKEIELIFK